MFIDTHTHIYLEQFDTDRAAMIDRARALGVDILLLPNIDIETLARLDQCVVDYPGVCYGMNGLHPCSVKPDYKKEIKKLEQAFANDKYVAIGEIGIDLHWDKSLYDEQVKAFEYQIDWAADLGLPFVIHSREALDINIEIVRKKQNGNLTGIFHCFNGDLAQANKIKEIGFLLGLGGVITYKNSGMGDFLEQMDMQQIVLETDAPYLSPVPKRGKRNEPSYIPHIVEKIADVKAMEIKDIAAVTTQNAIELFHLSPNTSV